MIAAPQPGIAQLAAAVGLVILCHDLGGLRGLYLYCPMRRLRLLLVDRLLSASDYQATVIQGLAAQARGARAEVIA